MKRRKLIAVLIMGMMAGIWAMPVFKMPCLDNGPLLVDGSLDDPCWQKALKTGDFKKLDGGVVKDRTEGFLFWKGEDLFVGMKCYFSERDAENKAIATCKQVFSIDVAEIFIDPGATGSYQQIAVNAAGKLWFPGRLRDVRYGVQLHEDHWSLEAQIPIRAIKINGSDFRKEWGINLARGNKTAHEDVTWAPLMNGTFHEPDGFYRLSGIDMDLDQLKKLQKIECAGDFEISLDRMLYDSQAAVKGTLDIKYTKSMKGFKVVTSVLSRKGRTLHEQVIRPVFFKTRFTIPLGKLPPDKYTLIMQLCDAQGKTLKSGKKTFWKIPVQRSTPKGMLTIKEHNLYLDGEFFFPIFTGAYFGDKHPTARKMPRESYLAFISDYYRKQIRAAGYNLVTTSVDITTETDFDIIKRYSKLPVWHWAEWKSRVARNITVKDMIEARLKGGVFSMLNPLFIKGHGEISEEMIDHWVTMMLQLRELDHVLMWDMADETDGAIANNRLRYQLYKEMDPRRPAWFNVINAVSQNQDFADILSTDPYPIPHRRVSMVGAHVDRLVQTFKDRPDKSYVIWLQLFGGEGEMWSRPPTPEEMEVMAYIAMNHGIKGIGWWIYQPAELRKLPRQNPATYERQKVVQARIAELAPAYCLGKKLLQNIQHEIDVAVLDYEGKLYVSCANTLNKPQTVSLVSGLKQSMKGKVMYEQRDLELREGRLTDHFKPYEVHIYCFQLGDR